jgi:hydroxymethylglutaryl-CoA lyase
MAIPNILAAIDCGVTDFDASVGGLGGCPYAPGATGNVCTEDLVHCLHEMGYETGVDLEALIDTAKRVEEVVGYPLPGQVMKAGPSSRRYQVPHHVSERLAAS